MTKNKRLAPAALLLVLASFASAAPSAPPVAKASEGTVLSVMASTQLHFGKLGIGALSTDHGTYLDEKRVRKEGNYAQLEFTVQGELDKFRQEKVHEGQTLEVAGYRIKVEAIAPGARGSAVLRLWAPPEPVKPAKKWPFTWFNFGRD